MYNMVKQYKYNLKILNNKKCDFITSTKLRIFIFFKYVDEFLTRDDII